MSGQSGLMRRFQAALELQQKRDEYFMRQHMCDLALLTLHDEFGFGPERLKRFVDALVVKTNDYCDLWDEDAKGREYSKDVLDRALKAACGQYFAPYEERYKRLEEMK